MNQPDVSQTVEAAQGIAYELRRTADSIDTLIACMQKSNDLTYAAEIVNHVANMLHNVRLDLMVTRPLRAMQRAH